MTNPRQRRVRRPHSQLPTVKVLRSVKNLHKAFVLNEVEQREALPPSCDLDMDADIPFTKAFHHE